MGPVELGGQGREMGRFSPGGMGLVAVAPTEF